MQENDYSGPFDSSIRSRLLSCLDCGPQTAADLGLEQLPSSRTDKIKLANKNNATEQRHHLAGLEEAASPTR